MSLRDKIIKQEDIDSGIHSGEAYIIWNQIVTRYDTAELADFILNFAKDADFKLLVQKGINNIIRPQIDELEKAARHYRLPLPPRPPLNQNLPANTEAIRDEFLFKLIIDGSQTALDVHVKAIKLCVNDSLRNLFMNFLQQETAQFDSLFKYGKIKGWIENAPAYKNN